MKIEEKTILWKPVLEYTGGRVLATNGLDILIGELNPEGDCVSEDCSGIHLCGITHFAKIDGFFPELKESEDERIRRDIIRYLKKTSPAIGENIEKMLAWLEKQGEFYTKRDVDNAYIEGMAFAKDELEKQNKQILANSAKTCKDEQKPTDEEMKTLLRTEYEKGKADVIAEFQKAWSEEDKNTIKDIIKDLEYAEKKGYVLKNNTFLKEINWLKSLIPQNTWKPSEDQMKALTNALSLAKNCGEESAFDLRTLYEQLKKLRRE